jgi:hypothetical protein
LAEKSKVAKKGEVKVSAKSAKATKTAKAAQAVSATVKSDAVESTNA